MKLFIQIALILSIGALLSACGPIYQTSYSYQAPQNIQAKQCIIQCQQAKTTCQSACQTQQFQCQQAAMEQARFNYAEYKSQQRISGQPIQRDLNSFYYGDQCNSSCGQCTYNFNDCYTLCGGKVLVHRQCVAFCGDNN